MALEQKLEAVLFYKAEPESKEKLAKLLEVSLEELEKAASELSLTLDSRGIRLLQIEDRLELVTAPETSEIINKTKKEELVKDLGKAGAETLAIILYRGPVSRVDIEYIRGVNCSFILRNLQIRGLVERIRKPNDSRAYLYQATPELLKHVGITKKENLPEYEQIQKKINSFENDRIETEEEVNNETPTETQNNE